MKFLPLLVLCGCATLKQDFKPLAGQSLNCLENASPNAFSQAGQAIATHETDAEIKGAAIGIALGVLECEAVAIWSDINHATEVAAIAGTDVPTVQVHAKAVLDANGVSVAVAAQPKAPPSN